MKKLFAIFTAVVLLPVSQTMAWVGGPFSNGNALPGGDDGVYEAIATTSNGLGIYRFAVRNNGVSSETAGTGAGGANGATTVSSNVQFSAGLLAASSSNVWYYKGITYYGTAFGTVNSDAGIVACVGNASTNQPIVGSLQGQAGNTGTAFSAGTGGVNGVVINGPQGNNIGYANSSWVAKIKKRESPTLRFRGTGEVSFVGEADVEGHVEAINPVTITAGGVFAPVTAVGPSVVDASTTQVIPQTPPNPPIVIQTPAAGVGTQPGSSTSISATTTVTSPSGNTVTTTTDGTRNFSFGSNTLVSTGGEDSDFDQRGHVRKFVIFGSRVSASVTP